MPPRALSISSTTGRVQSADYDVDTAELLVRLANGTTLRYHNVPETVAVAMEEAPSAGAFINKSLKGYGYDTV